MLYQARRELDRQLADLVPPGKRGLAATIIDKDGVKVGVGAVHRGTWATVTLTAEVQKRWATKAPEFSVKVQALW
jgi:hypothetical protein